MVDPILNDMISDVADYTTPQPKERRGITLWLSPEDKARWDALQMRSHKRFGKKAREVLLKLIEMAERGVSSNQKTAV